MNYCNLVLPIGSKLIDLFMNRFGNSSTVSLVLWVSPKKLMNYQPLDSSWNCFFSLSIQSERRRSSWGGQSEKWDDEAMPGCPQRWLPERQMKELPSNTFHSFPSLSSIFLKTPGLFVPNSARISVTEQYLSFRGEN